MAKKVYLKLLMVITGLLLQCNLWAQDVPPITLHVETAGTLPAMIGETRKYQITDLTLTGNLNSTDIRFIREMVGRDYEGDGNSADGFATNGKLIHLDLSGANIVSGGVYYLNYYLNYYYSIKLYTNNNQIPESMFSRCEKLRTIFLPNSVTSIGGNAFYGCTGLTSITIPNSVMSIGSGAFRDCTKLTSVTIGNSVTSIGEGAFRGCTKLTSVTIPNSVGTIGGSAFSGCTSLTSVTIPNSVGTIGGSAFSGCTGLTSVTIGNSVKSIGGSAFYGCTGLISITIPNSVTSIESGAFYNCTGLTSVTIPNSVTSIGHDAFYNCTKLFEIHSKNPTPPTLGSSVFGSVTTTTCKLYVPKGSYMAYWLIWGFDNIIEEDYATIATINKENITVKPISNGIIIETKEKTPVSVFNLSGQKVYQSVINGNAEIQLDKGVYIVRVNNESEKVIVK